MKPIGRDLSSPAEQRLREFNLQVWAALSAPLVAQLAIDEFRSLPWWKRLWYWMVSI